MKIKRLTPLFALVAGLVMVCGSMSAHHGTGASYDMEKTITLTGTVTEFVWSNPHTQIYFDVKDEKGNVVQWGAESNSPAQSREHGFTKDTIKPGDHVTITLCPSKAGTPRGVLTKLVLSDGRTLSTGFQGRAGGN